MFGMNKPFGTASTFGGSTFGNTSTPFEQRGFGAATAQSGTTIKFNPPTGSDSKITQGVYQNISVRFQCITFMKEYANKSLEELRMEDYLANRKGGGMASNTDDYLSCNRTPNLLKVKAESQKIFMDQSSGRAHHPGPGKTGTVGLIKSSLTIQLSQNFLYMDERPDNSPAYINWKGGFGAATAQSGTTIKFNPPMGYDTMMKQGVSQNISTCHQCITCMMEYGNKSLEELRVEDYLANRKGGGAASMVTLGATAAPSTGLIGQALFGSNLGITNTFGSGMDLFNQPAATQNIGHFTKPIEFGAITTAAPPFNFGGTPGNSLVGQNTQQKTMFWHTSTTGLFEGTTTTPATGFGAGTAFGGFGATKQQKPATGFDTTTGFGAPTSGMGAFNAVSNQTPAANSVGPLGQTKPAIVFGQTGGGLFVNTGLSTGSGNASFSGVPGAGTGTGPQFSSVNLQSVQFSADFLEIDQSQQNREV